MKEDSEGVFAEYMRAVQVASLRFQYVEEALKMYIGTCYQIISKRLSSRLSFHYGYDDVRDMPLGRLIRVFKKLNSQKHVVEQLEALVKDRNHCAHQAYLMTSTEIHDPAYLAGELGRVKAVAEKADRTCKALFDEIKAIEALKEGWS